MAMATILGPSALRVLLVPINSPIIGGAICNFAGALYPVYATFRALEEKDKEISDPPSSTKSEDLSEFRIWSCYWAVYGCFKALESLVDPILSKVPYYYPAKLLLFLWLQLPQFRGASFLYNKYVKPVLQKYQPKIEIILQELKKSEWVIEANMTYLVMLQELAQASYANVKDFVKWFFTTDAPEKPKLSPERKEE